MRAVCRALDATDYPQAHALYQTLATGETLPPFEAGKRGFSRIISHPDTWIIGACEDGKVLSMATLHLMPNLTNDMRPYALVENVATLADFQGRGLGRTVMHAVAEKAWQEGAYKIMLLTNRSRGTAAFYTKLGYQMDEKQGMILRQPAPF